MAFTPFQSRVVRWFLDAGMQDVDGSEALFFNGNDDYQIASNQTILNVGFSSTNFSVRGSRRVRFNKLSLNTLFRGVTPVVYLYTPRSKREVAQALIDRYGLPLQAEWFADEAIPTATGNLEDFTVKLWLNLTLFTMGGDEYNFLTVRVLRANADLATLFKDNVLDTPVMPYVIRSGYKNTELMTYGKDFTPSTEERFVALKSIASSQDLYGTQSPSLELSNTLVEILSDRLGIPVTKEADVDGALCVHNATFVYNGPTTGLTGADVWYDNVLVFDTVIDPLDSTARDYRGRCWLHYNNMI